MSKRRDEHREGPGSGESGLPDRDLVESRVVTGLPRESLFKRLLEVERFPEWGYGLRRVKLHRSPSDKYGHAESLRPGDRIEFSLRAAGVGHRVESRITRVDPPELIEWRYLSGASGYGGWLLEEVQDEVQNEESPDHLVRMTLSTDYSVHPEWLDRLAHRPFFRGLISDLTNRSLQRLEDSLDES